MSLVQPILRVSSIRPRSLFESGFSTGAVSLRALFEGDFATLPHASDNPLTLDDIARLVCRGGWSQMSDFSDLSDDEAIEFVADSLERILHVDLSRLDGVKRNPDWAYAILSAYAAHVGEEASLSDLAHRAAKDAVAGVPLGPACSRPTSRHSRGSASSRTHPHGRPFCVRRSRCESRAFAISSTRRSPPRCSDGVPESWRKAADRTHRRTRRSRGSLRTSACGTCAFTPALRAAPSDVTATRAV